MTAEMEGSPHLRNAVWFMLAVVVAAISASAAASAGASQLTLRLNGKIVSISADGTRVAINSALVTGGVGGKLCAYAHVWNESTRTVTTIPTPTECENQDATVTSFFNDYFTLSGTRLAWLNYQFANQAYCDGPYTATLSGTTPADLNLGSCDGNTADVYWRIFGSDGLLVGAAYSPKTFVCQAACGPPGPSSGTGVVLYRIGATGTQLKTLPDGTALLAVSANRIVLLGGVSLDIVDPSGHTVTTIAAPSAKITAAFLADSELVAQTGTSLLTYNAHTGAAVPTQTIPAGSKLIGFANGKVLYTHGTSIHLRQLSTGTDKPVANVPGLVGAKLSSAGLFYGYNTTSAFKPGRVTFIKSSALPA